MDQSITTARIVRVALENITATKGAMSLHVMSLVQMLRITLLRHLTMAPLRITMMVRLLPRTVVLLEKAICLANQVKVIAVPLIGVLHLSITDIRLRGSDITMTMRIMSITMITSTMVIMVTTSIMNTTDHHLTCSSMS